METRVEYLELQVAVVDSHESTLGGGDHDVESVVGVLADGVLEGLPRLVDVGGSEEVVAEKAARPRLG
ncbi:MAG: hypothetical protein SV760_10345, partial [Halobacteria archaeon]|nr:hypothetical protein [Halobacteria archaeon]